MLYRGEWHTWWRAEAAPQQWRAADPRVAGAVRWRPVAPGVQQGELVIDGAGAWRLRVVLIRLDPRQLRLELEAAEGWSVDAAPAHALVAVNAGQFAAAGPWGWVVRGGREERPPGRGPLAVAVAMDSAGVRWLDDDGVSLARRTAPLPSVAFQSYPLVLAGDGSVPAPLVAPGRGVDLGHRDSRLALGQLRDGRLLLALTRIDVPAPVLAAAPWGPTVPEMAALMGALGCARAVLLDGGISGQLLLRDETGVTRRWRGFRKVPLALVAYPRSRDVPIQPASHQHHYGAIP